MTRDEAIKRLKETRSTIQPFGYVDEALDVAIKVLQQESVLDKIRAEIEGLTYYCCEVHPRNVIDDVLEIIDKYKEESEG